MTDASLARQTMKDGIRPGGVIGILGGGQLGRMTALAAAELGYRTVIFDPDANCPAGHVAETVTAAYTDRDALDRFSAKVDVVTLEFENVPVEALTHLAQTVPVRPGATVLSAAQDRAVEKTFLNDAGIETAPWATIETPADIDAAVAKIGLPAVLKTSRLGYDGKGQAMIQPGDDVRAAFERFGRVPCVLEGLIDFECELSVIAARRDDGASAVFPPVMNEHRDHILYKTHAPAGLPDAVEQEAVEIARKATEGLSVTGLLAVEMFLTKQGTLLVNEVAPRPHNSGHWTMDACATSQFQQLVRAVCGLPLGSTDILYPAVMTNLLGDECEEWSEILSDPRAKLHLYGKSEARPGRKMGHVNRPK